MKWPYLDGSDLTELVSLDGWIGTSKGIPTDCLVIEFTIMLLGVPVGPTESYPTPAFEPGQTHLLPACTAPVRRHRYRCWCWHRLSSSLLHRCATSRRFWYIGQEGDRRGVRWDRFRERRVWRRERFLNGRYGRGRLLFLHVVLSVALGAEIQSGRTAEESTIVRASARPLLPLMFLSHRSNWSWIWTSFLQICKKIEQIS